jgi:hypothetical protein
MYYNLVRIVVYIYVWKIPKPSISIRTLTRERERESDQDEELDPKWNCINQFKLKSISQSSERMRCVYTKDRIEEYSQSVGICISALVQSFEEGVDKKNSIHYEAEKNSHRTYHNNRLYVSTRTSGWHSSLFVVKFHVHFKWAWNVRLVFCFFWLSSFAFPLLMDGANTPSKNRIDD